jgi:hypothetical protein
LNSIVIAGYRRMNGPPPYPPLDDGAGTEPVKSAYGVPSGRPLTEPAPTLDLAGCRVGGRNGRHRGPCHSCARWTRTPATLSGTRATSEPRLSSNAAVGRSIRTDLVSGWSAESDLANRRCGRDSPCNLRATSSGQQRSRGGLRRCERERAPGREQVSCRR